MDKMKKLVIFDLDGTLLNTIADLAQSTNHALAELGYPVHDEDSYRQRVGNGINKLFERALPEGEKTEENVLRMRQAFIPYYNIHNADRSLPYPGIPALLAHLQQKGIRLAVASNKYQAATSKLIAHYFPAITFAAVLGQREGIPVNLQLVSPVLEGVALGVHLAGELAGLSRRDEPAAELVGDGHTNQKSARLGPDDLGDAAGDELVANGVGEAEHARERLVIACTRDLGILDLDAAGLGGKDDERLLKHG